MNPTEPAPADPRATPEPGDAFGQYVRRRELGRGGFGAVYLAHDTRLQRPAALKILRSDDPEDLARFEREAMLAAGLSHPNIAAVYDVGRERGQMYLAMQFIDGVTAGRRPLDAARAAAVVRDAARAVHYAHQQGVIHRDLKPDNLMIDSQGRVFVMDFGLAKRLETDSSISLTGTVLGTPAYMPPEQARGETRLDARADVYALGATLHHLVAGRRPFEGASPYEVLRKVMEEDPPDPGAAVPIELKLIVRKAMEKDPARRYATAAALAGDLQRYLDGETIEARPATLTYRLRKRIARNPWAWTFAGATLAVTAVAAGVSVLLERERDSLIGEMRIVTDLQLDLALEKRRAGKLDEMKALLPQVEAACDRVIDRAPELAEPHYRKGRMYRAMMMARMALEEQNRAVELDPTYGPARYERGMIRYVSYDSALEEARRRWWALQSGHLIDPVNRTIAPGLELREPTFDDLVSVHRDVLRLRAEAEEDLRAAGDHPTARGLSAMMARDNEEAVRLLKASLEADPYQESATIWLSTLVGSDEWLTRAIERDRGYIPYYRARAQARKQSSEDAYAAGRVDEALRFIRAAVDDGDAAIRLDATDPVLWTERGVYREVHGTLAMTGGEDPQEDFRNAIADYDRALELEAGFLNALLGRASVRGKRAVLRAGRGRDSDEDFRAAVADLSAALDRDAARLDIRHERGTARANWAGVVRDRGEDPTALFDASIADMDEAIRIKPTWSVPWEGRAIARIGHAVFLRREGRDYQEELETAVADLTQALALSERSATALMRRGLARNLLALDHYKKGEDPRPVYELAARDLQSAADINPAAADTWACLGDVWVNWGVYDMIARRDPREKFRAGTDAHQKAVDLNPSRADVWVSMGNAFMAWGAWVIEYGGVGAPLVERGIEAVDRAIDLNPANAEAWWKRGQCHQILARWQEALDDCDRALRHNPALKAQIQPTIDKCRTKLRESDF